jgi:hypothetical protein
MGPSTLRDVQLHRLYDIRQYGLDRFGCRRCGSTWTVPGPRDISPKTWWMCPRGCNREKIARPVDEEEAG